MVGENAQRCRRLGLGTGKLLLRAEHRVRPRECGASGARMVFVSVDRGRVVDEGCAGSGATCLGATCLGATC